MLAVLLRVHEYHDRPVIEGNDMAFGSDIRCSEDKDGKDLTQQIHDPEARWAEVVKSYWGGMLRPHLKKHPRFLCRPERHKRN
jgi:hypothetical protein